MTLGMAMVADPTTLTSANFDSVPPSGTPHAVGTSPLSFFPSDGSSFGILTTGNALFAPVDNTSGSAGAALGGNPLADRGPTAQDITVLALKLNAPANANCLKLDFAFYSEEFPEFVGSQFNDAFIAELDHSTWTANGAPNAPDNFAFDDKGAVVSINNTGQTSMSALNAGGTTYDGATVLLEAARQVAPGPHTLYLSIFDEGDQIYDSAAFVDNIRFVNVNNPTTDCKPGAQRKRPPLVLLPGISGTKMVNQPDGELWPNGTNLLLSSSDDFLLKLRLANDGVAPWDATDPAYNTVRTDDIIRSVLGQGVYNKTVESLEKSGYKEGVDLFAFPFDWRKDVRTQSVNLLTRIDEIRQQTGAQQVDILAHSQGGLVTLAALRDPASVGKVRKVLTLGTPVLGATKALGVLEYRMPCFVEAPVLGCITNAETLQTAISNFPGLYELLPSRAFDSAVHPPLSIDRDTNGDGVPEGSQPYDKWSAIVKSHRNANLVDQADQFHQTFDTLSLADSSVQFYRVVGDSLGTPAWIREYDGQDCKFIWFDCKTVVKYEVKYTDGTNGDGGDGTVPLHSADLHNPISGFDARGGVPDVYAHKVSHGDLPKDDNVLNFAVAFYGAATPTNASVPAPSPGPSPSPNLLAKPAAATALVTRTEHDPRTDQPLKPSAAPIVPKALATTPAAISANAAPTGVDPSQFGLDSTPQPFGGIELEVTGPATGAVQDQTGKTLSITDRSIPHADYNAIGDMQSFFLNDAGTYQATLTTSAQLATRVRVRSYANNQQTGQAVFWVSAPAGARLRLDFTSGQDLAALRLGVDRNADGIVDDVLAPDAAVVGGVQDTQAPVTTATVASAAAGQAQVTLLAQDNAGGAGVASTYYRVGTSGEPTRYTAPFGVPFGSIVQFASSDKNGNVEQGKQVAIPTVAAGGPYTVAEGGSVAVAATGSDPSGGTVQYAWDLDNDGTFETSGQSATLSAAKLDGPSTRTIVARVTTAAGVSVTANATLSVTNVPPSIGAIGVPTTPVIVGQPLAASAPFTDPGIADTHTAVWDWHDGSTSPGAVTETNGSGSVANSHTYTSAGLYKLGLTVTDKDGGVASATSVQNVTVAYDICDLLAVGKATEQGVKPPVALVNDLKAAVKNGTQIPILFHLCGTTLGPRVVVVAQVLVQQSDPTMGVYTLKFTYSGITRTITFRVRD
jgi:pimeloyl-ACP methyl ester carboxylesterase